MCVWRFLFVVFRLVGCVYYWDGCIIVGIIVVGVCFVVRVGVVCGVFGVGVVCRLLCIVCCSRLCFVWGWCG